MLGASSFAAATLLEAASWPRGSTARIRVLRRSSLDTTAVQQASELFHAQLGSIGTARCFGRTPETLSDCTKTGPDGLLKVRGVHSLHTIAAQAKTQATPVDVAFQKPGRDTVHAYSLKCSSKMVNKHSSSIRTNLAPHFAVPAKNELAKIRGSTPARILRVHRLPVNIQIVQVPGIHALIVKRSKAARALGMAIFGLALRYVKCCIALPNKWKQFRLALHKQPHTTKSDRIPRSGARCIHLLRPR